MRKSIFCLVALLIGAASLSAQNYGQQTKTQPQDTVKKVKTENPEKAAKKAVKETAKETAKKASDESRNKFFVTIQGGGLLSLNENFRAYGDEGKNSDLLTGQGSASFGYQITPVSGVRLWAGYSNNRSACNKEETSGHRFYPYKFNSINVFADYVMDFSGFGDNDWTVVPKLYAGVHDVVNEHVDAVEFVRVKAVTGSLLFVAGGAVVAVAGPETYARDRANLVAK